METVTTRRRSTLRRTVTPHMTDQPGVRFGIANAVVVVALLVAGGAGLGNPEIEGVALLATGIASAGLPTLMTTGVGLAGWAWFTGFVENQYGQLSFSADDVRRLLLFAAVTVVLSWLAAPRRFRTGEARA